MCSPDFFPCHGWGHVTILPRGPRLQEADVNARPRQLIGVPPPLLPSYLAVTMEAS